MCTSRVLRVTRALPLGVLVVKVRLPQQVVFAWEAATAQLDRVTTDDVEIREGVRKNFLG